MARFASPAASQQSDSWYSALGSFLFAPSANAFPMSPGDLRCARHELAMQRVHGIEFPQTAGDVIANGGHRSNSGSSWGRVHLGLDPKYEKDRAGRALASA